MGRRWLILGLALASAAAPSIGVAQARRNPCTGLRTHVLRPYDRPGLASPVYELDPPLPNRESDALYLLSPSRLDVNRDGRRELKISPIEGFEESTAEDGSPVVDPRPWSSPYGYAFGVALRCAPDAIAIVVDIGEYATLDPTPTTTPFRGVEWTDLVTAERVDAVYEGMAETYGVDMAPRTVLRFSRGGYVRARGGENEQCARLRAQGHLEAARRWCESALRHAVALPPNWLAYDEEPRPPLPREVARVRRLRGAIHYNLGRIAEDEGDADRARSHYEDSLRERPGDATVQARLRALGPASEGASAD